MALTTSNTYNFQNTLVDTILREAFERCGRSAEDVSVIQATSAINSMNLMFVDWINRGLNLFAEDTQAIQIINAQSTYPLAAGTVDILEGTAVQYTRQLNGTPYSSEGGNASNAFDGNPNTSCTQTAPNGYISYNYGAGNSFCIQYIGVQSNVTQTYTLLIQYSYTGLDNSWITCYNPGPMQYTAGIPTWFVPQVPQAAQYWRIIETGGATLDIQELYFCTHAYSRQMDRMSRDEYMGISNKYIGSATPTAFLVWRTDIPSLILWPNPTTLYPLFVYTRRRYIQDVNQLIQYMDSPQRFYDAVAAGLAARLALKYFPEKYAVLSQEAEQAYNIAAREDIERVPLKITIDKTYQYNT